MSNGDETYTITPAERRLTNRLVTMGVLMGALVIAVVILAFGYWNTVINEDNKRSVPSLEQANTELGKDLTKASDSIKEMKLVKEKDDKYIAFLRSEYRRLARRDPPAEPPPSIDVLDITR